MSETTETSRLETEEDLIRRAQAALSGCNWEVGDCAAQWTRRYARGRTDADFARLVGLTPDQVYQRRRVAEKFAGIRQQFPSLRWSHFYAALTWDDARQSLQWAEENQATVAEMKAWRRVQRGEELPAESSPEELREESLMLDIADEPAVVRQPNENTATTRMPESVSGGDHARERAATLAGVSRHGGEDDQYAPYRSGAARPAPSEEGQVARATSPRTQSTLSIIKRSAAALCRIHDALSPEVLQEFPSLPEAVRTQFTAAVGRLSSKVAGLL